MIRPPTSFTLTDTLFSYPSLFRSSGARGARTGCPCPRPGGRGAPDEPRGSRGRLRRLSPGPACQAPSAAKRSDELRPAAKFRRSEQSSEEQTSKLQHKMRISKPASALKKKSNNITHTQTHHY